MVTTHDGSPCFTSSSHRDYTKDVMVFGHEVTLLVEAVVGMTRVHADSQDLSNIGSNFDSRSRRFMMFKARKMLDKNTMVFLS